MFKKMIKAAAEGNEQLAKSRQGKWIWVEGFKGTDKDMKCNGYQYELGKQHDMPEDAEIVECLSGFHLCKRLENVFGYYPVGSGRRFFKVKALVRKQDWDACDPYFVTWGPVKNKVVSKSIIFEEELEPTEILVTAGYLRGSPVIEYWTDERKLEALQESPEVVEVRIKREILNRLGYSDEFARYIIAINNFQIARALGTQKDISMDTRVNNILKNINTN
jgi:hypothetical protein